MITVSRRVAALLALVASIVASGAGAQGATVIGQAVLKETGAPLSYTTVSILPRGAQLLTRESASFLLRDLTPGVIRLRFKRIGFAPKDTSLTLASGDTARIRVEMTRLVIQLPAMLVSGRCTDSSPFAAQPAILAELFDQVTQNAERVRLLTNQRPFNLEVIRLRGTRARDNRVVPTQIDTVVRAPLPEDPYVPRQVVQRGKGIDVGKWVVKLPELSDLADTAFTNNHCLRYAGQTRFEYDSVIRVDFEPVPSLAKEVDIEGSMYLRVDGYQLVGMIMKLNRIPSELRNLHEFSVLARFREFVSGVPVLAEWELTNRFRNLGTPARIELGQVTGLKWLDSLTAVRDTISRPSR